MPVRLSLLIAVLLLLLAPGASSQPVNEFHSGSGGFAVAVGDVKPLIRDIPFKLDEMFLFGNSLIFDLTDVTLQVSALSVVNTRSVSTNRPDIGKALTRLKDEIIRTSRENKSEVVGKPYSFGSDAGFELVIAGDTHQIIRGFPLKGRLFLITLSSKGDHKLDFFRPAMDSFRVLARRERMIAMVDEAMPPPLDQQLPNSITVSDASELGLIGGVRRTRETTQLSPKSEKLFSRELRFDQNGFILRDIQFNTGYPEVITSWGWLSGSRINMQSPMNFFDEDRPMGSRNVTTSGFSPTISTTRPRYGNRFEVGYDTSGRIHWRKCFTNSGSLVSIENFKYDRDWREIKSTDSSGGFLSAVRERFDRNHNLIEAQTLFDTGRIVSSTRFEYQFDAQGNWIVKKVFRGSAKSPSKPTETYYREIEYFDATLLKNWN